MEVCRYQQLMSSSSSSISGGGGGGVYCELPPRPVGFRFVPEENHLIGYLQNKLNNLEAQFPLILEKNIYDDDDCHPQQLLESHGTEGVVYLFSQRFRKYPKGKQIRRDTKHGLWKNSTPNNPVIHEGVEIGRKCSFIFHPSPDHEATKWCLWEFWIPNAKSRDEPANQNLMDGLAIYKLYSTAKDPERQGQLSGIKRVKEPNTSIVKLPAKKLAKGVSRGLRKVKALPAKEFAQGDSRGLQKVEAAYNVHKRQLQHGVAQVGNGQAHYNYNEFSYNEVNYHEQDYKTNEKFVQDIDWIMNSDRCTVHDFDVAGLSSTSNMLSLQKDSMEPSMSAFPYSPAFTNFNPWSSVNRQSTYSFYNGWENNHIVENHNGLQGDGFAGGGFGRSQYGHELPPLPDKLVPNDNLYCRSSVTQMYSDIASVPSHAPLEQECPGELPPY